MIKRTTVRLPADLLKKAQRKAAAEGRTLTALMEDGLRYVVSDKPAEKRERKMPRVSSATGGLGFRSFKEYQEWEDLQYMERLRQGFK